MLLSDSFHFPQVPAQEDVMLVGGVKFVVSGQGGDAGKGFLVVDADRLQSGGQLVDDGGILLDFLLVEEGVEHDEVD